MPKKIKLNGPVISDGGTWVYDWLNMPYISASKLSKELDDARGDDIELYINSPGGSVFVGSEVYTLLKEYAGKVTAKITGVAASAASFFLMAADEIKMSPPSQLMIHNAATRTEGDKNEHSSNTEMLQGTDVAITNAYRLKTGKSTEDLLNLMNKTTWMNAQQAVELGFADGILFDEGNVLTNVSNSISGEIPDEVINRIRDFLINSMLKEGGAEALITNSDKSILEGLDLTAILPQGILQLRNSMEDVAIQDPVNEPEIKEATEKMDIKQLKNEHPDLFNQITNDGKEQGRKEERERINSLNVLAKAPGAAEIVAKAIEDGRTAAEAAIEIVNASAVRITEEGNSRKNDAAASNATQVLSQEEDTPEQRAEADEAKAQAEADEVIAEMKRLRGGK
ncbi:head maturation protease, ClpP-related [Paenibacillus sp. Marseille-Q4541]|uniref:head maturation protease, ClpP-related n=1 Tax=Paenibacillus sp. Marseille-Q4541 TaxID=2831522 RepID=UPI001BA703C3|nr:head maturation protease, ClpP-related [Paenibacillus sp. Marseille-Q4541]